MVLRTGGKVKGDNPVLEMFTTGAEYPGLDGIMGNNMIPLIQLPRTQLGAGHRRTDMG